MPRSAGAAVAKLHRLDGSHSRIVFPLSSGGWKSSGCGFSQGLSPGLADGYVLTWPLLCEGTSDISVF